MTDQNNAAQAATQEAVRHALEIYAECYDTMTRIADREGREPVVSPVSVAFDIRKNMVNAVVDALSKLRAEGVQAGDERGAFVAWLTGSYPNAYSEPEAVRLWHLKHVAALAWEERGRRAAPASAQVDPEAAEVDFLARVLESLDAWRAEDWSELLERRPAILALLRPMVLASAPVATPKRAPVDDGICWSSKEIQRRQKEGDDARAAYYRSLASAPVAGEAVGQIVLFGGDLKEVSWRDGKMPPPGTKLYAAPQASEAVRIQFPAHLRKMWSGGEVQSWLDDHQGVTATKPSAKGSLERYRKWQAERDESFGAGVKAAADLVKKMVDDYDADLGSTDPETGTREYPGEGATWVCEMQELEESIRALSAQPGAQKEQSDA